MGDDQPELSIAVQLMRMALALLDKGGEGEAATHLQHAIDQAIGALVPRTQEQVEALLKTAEARRLLKRLNLGS